MPDSSMHFATLKTTQKAVAKRKLRPEEALSRSQALPRHANYGVAIPLGPCLREPGWRWVQEMGPSQRLASLQPPVQPCFYSSHCDLPALQSPAAPLVRESECSVSSPRVLEATLIQQLCLCICGVSGRPYVGRLHPTVGQKTSGEETELQLSDHTHMPNRTRLSQSSSSVTGPC